ncbi:hypothetical protein HGRIS_011228 [Hohenbuehelia grisea]|uniref:Uncharacterized protein n=1 Tax=Hohenbuehelia grisea TaxID=104357 RepID=A0ABR3JUP5_9AGAR
MRIQLEHKMRRLMKVNNHGDEFFWNMDTVHNLLAAAAVLKEFICVFTLQTLGPGPRASEFVDYKLVNSHRARNIFVNQDKTYLCNRRVKNENQMNHEVFILMMAHPRLGDILRQYFIVIRPMEQELARIAWSEEVGQLYDEFPWVQNGAVVTSAKLSDQLKTRMLEFCNINNAGAHNSHQLDVEFGRVYLGDDFVRKQSLQDQDQDILAQQRGHSLAVERQVYANEVNHLPGLSSDAVMEFECRRNTGLMRRALCQAFHPSFLIVSAKKSFTMRSAAHTLQLRHRAVLRWRPNLTGHFMPTESCCRRSMQESSTR